MAADVTASSIGYLLFTILIGLSIPFCLYSISQFYSFREDKRFRKRHGKLSTFTALCFVAELFSGCLLTLAFSSFMSINLSIGLAWIGDILNIISYFLIIHFLVLRFWMVYYDTKYQLSIKDNVWKSLIDEHYIINAQHLSAVKSFDIEDDLWFIKNKHREGNSKWMFKVWFSRSFITLSFILLIMLIIEMVFSVGLRRGIIEVIFTILLMIPFFFMIYIYHKIPPFHDIYFIRKEIVVIHNLDLIDVVASAVVSIIANYGIYTSANNNNNRVVIQNTYLNTIMIITFYIMGVSHIVIVYIMTYWVRSKIIQDRQHITSLGQQYSVEMGNDGLTLQRTLEHQFGYELFMEHLANEFSIENLLSLTEFMQFKCMIKNDHINDTKLQEQELEINLPMDYIPKSSIVFNEKDTKYSQKVCKLYDKYISTGSEHEINLSWRIRKEFNQFIEQYNKAIDTQSHIILTPNEYFVIFDGCIVEVLRLMGNDSYWRFTHTDKCKQLKKAMAESC